MTVHLFTILIIPDVSSNIIMPCRQDVQLQKSTYSILLSINPSSSLGLRTAKILLFATLAKRLNSQKISLEKEEKRLCLP
jgi:hypothetical protein